MIYFAKENELSDFANDLASLLKSPLVLTFSGEIGAGKTTLIRAMLRALNITSAIKSPTFSLVESYFVQKMHIHHFDLYRILDEEELEYIGFRDYFKPDSICCIEWPERAINSLDCVDLQFALAHAGAGRTMQIKALSPSGEQILSCLKGKYEGI
ncbi:MAG: tRNA (adenosine(37)-N6)-threonylcarbamoyltransferase complex ATPase subunit type 1 TsaE [Proteobacteria bacterium]|nr:tRNA (adenosine(37)-N6)-threonylcarbamoyltransferase complex ATPase subunit type 1 TsaE [Pseudomonadota bacterium]